MEFATRQHSNHGPGAPQTGPPVPAGWAARYNEQYQTWFYVNVYTKISQWDPPTIPVFPPGAPDENKNPYEPAVPAIYHSSDEELARRLQAEEDAAGHHDVIPPPQPARPAASPFDAPAYSPSPAAPAVASSPYVADPYANGGRPYGESGGNYSLSGGQQSHYPPGPGVNPYSAGNGTYAHNSSPQYTYQDQVYNQGHEPSKSGASGLAGKAFEKVGKKVPLVAGLGAAAGLASGASSKPSSRPSSAHGYPYGGDAATYSTTPNGNLAPPGAEGAPGLKKKKSGKWKYAAAGGGGAALLGGGALAGYGIHEGAEKVKNKLFHKKSSSSFGGSSSKWDWGGGDEEEGDEGGDDGGGDDGGDDGDLGGALEDLGGGDDGGGIGEILGALLGG